MARYVIDPVTLLHVVDSELRIDPSHQVSRRTGSARRRCSCCWDAIRDAGYLAVTRLQADALVTVDTGLATRAEGVVPVAPLQALLTGE